MATSRQPFPGVRRPPRRRLGAVFPNARSQRLSGWSNRTVFALNRSGANRSPPSHRRVFTYSSWVGSRITAKRFSYPPTPPAVLGRTRPLACEAARVPQALLARPDRLERDLVFPAVSEVVLVLGSDTRAGEVAGDGDVPARHDRLVALERVLIRDADLDDVVRPRPGHTRLTSVVPGQGRASGGSRSSMRTTTARARSTAWRTSDSSG